VYKSIISILRGDLHESIVIFLLSNLNKIKKGEINMHKPIRNIVILFLALCICFAFSGTALAFSEQKEYINAETALKLYTELYEKYYPGEKIVTIDESKYIPVEAEKFYQELNALEENIKIAILPENNVKVEYDSKGRIVSLVYSEKYKKYAQRYIDTLSRQKLKESRALSSNTTLIVPAAGQNKTVWDGYDKVITSIPWHPTCVIGYIAKFYTNNYTYPHFTQTATNFSPEVMYSGLGSCTAYISATSQELLDSRRTDAVSVRIGYTAKVTANGSTQTYSDYVNIYHEHYASSYW